MTNLVSRMRCSAKLLRSGAPLLRDRPRTEFGTVPGLQRTTSCCAAPGTRAPEWPLLLADVPQHDEAGIGDDAFDAIGAVRQRLRPLAERNIDDLLDRPRLQVAGGLLPLLLGLREGMGVAQLLDFRIARPAEQPLV